MAYGDAPAPVAVRSSALDEDGPTASFAGQHETVLNVVGLDAVLAAVERTWRSLRSEAALTYRRAHGLPETGLALAVLVQRMVRADVSGSPSASTRSLGATTTSSSTLPGASARAW